MTNNALDSTLSNWAGKRSRNLPSHPSTVPAITMTVPTMVAHAAQSSRDNLALPGPIEWAGGYHNKKAII
jgi:hypothetical protein